RGAGHLPAPAAHRRDAGAPGGAGRVGGGGAGARRPRRRGPAPLPRGGVVTRREVAGWGLALLLAWVVAYPLVLVLVGAVRDAAGWTLVPLRRFGAEPQEWAALRGSLVISFASVALAAAVGVPLAFLFGRREFPGRRLLAGLVALPA